MISNKSAKLILFAAAISIVAALIVPDVLAYSEQVYHSLQKSRNALLDQRNQLKKSIDVTKRQISELQSKLRTLESYLYQTEKDLTDVETAMRR